MSVCASRGWVTLSIQRVWAGTRESALLMSPGGCWSTGNTVGADDLDNLWSKRWQRNLRAKGKNLLFLFCALVFFLSGGGEPKKGPVSHYRKPLCVHDISASPHPHLPHDTPVHSGFFSLDGVVHNFWAQPVFSGILCTTKIEVLLG